MRGLITLPLALALASFAGCGTDDDDGPYDYDSGADTSTADSGMDAGDGGDGGDGGDCPTGETRCGDSCVDTMNDSLNCGMCGNGCADSTCRMGECDSSCPDDTIVCGVRCCPLPGGCDASGNSCAPVVPPCPADPPTEGEACGDVDYTCVYPRCDAEGEVTATCESTWSVGTVPCGDFSCTESSMTCTGDQLCVAVAGGALLVECRANTCGDMTIETSCACEACPAGATCNVTGRNVTCNTCPSGLCP